MLSTTPWPPGARRRTAPSAGAYKVAQKQIMETPPGSSRRAQVHRRREEELQNVYVIPFGGAVVKDAVIKK